MINHRFIAKSEIFHEVPSDNRAPGEAQLKNKLYSSIQLKMIIEMIELFQHKDCVARVWYNNHTILAPREPI
jgi:hypothetical protein